MTGSTDREAHVVSRGTEGTPAGLSPVERELWAAYPTGATVDLGGRADRVVRASMLGRLLLGGNQPQPGFVPAVRLKNAHITGRLDVSGGTVGCELRLDTCVLDEAPKFANAQTGQLRFADCVMPGFDGGGLRCDGYLSMSGSTITGLLKLPRAQLLGGFRLNKTKISNPDPGDWAVFTGGLIVEAGTFIRNAEITGGVRLVGARLNGGLFFEGTTLRATGGRPALDAQNIVVTDAMECSGDFRAEGQMRLRGAQINGTLSFSRAILDSSASQARLALHASHMRADELILWTKERIRGGVSLSYSRIGVILDSAESWPDQIYLNGLTYDSLRGAEPNARLRWVGRDPEFHLEPYEQLADWFRRSGREDLARETQLAKLRSRRQVSRPVARVYGYLLDWAVGYGYRPWRAGWWFGLLLAAGTVIFSLVKPHQLKNPQDIPDYHAFSYTLDLLMPVPLFGQRDHWNATGWTIWFAYALIVSGWVLVTALIAAATRILRPN